MRTEKAISEFLQNRRANNLSQATLQCYRTRLKRFAATYPKLPAKPELIETFLSSLPCSPETRVNYYLELKSFYRFIRQRRRFPNPMEQVAPPHCPRKLMATLEPEEELRLLSSASKPRDRAMLTLFIDTGIRVGELIGLRKFDIKLETILVCGKSGEREVPFSEETKYQLLSLAADRGEAEYIFRGHKGPMTRAGVYAIVSALMRRAGIRGPKLGPHRIRHGFGKCYLVNGGDLRSLQQIMGHAKITTTEKYASLNLQDTITKHHKFTPLRAAHAAAQEHFFDKGQAIKEAEAIVKRKDI